jgi:hypothetical protein
MQVTHGSKAASGKVTSRVGGDLGVERPLGRQDKSQVLSDRERQNNAPGSGSSEHRASEQNSLFLRSSLLIQQV